jgi:hypothetical protein
MTIVWLIIALLTAMAVWPVTAHLVGLWWRSSDAKLQQFINDALEDR